MAITRFHLEGLHPDLIRFQSYHDLCQFICTDKLKVNFVYHACIIELRFDDHKEGPGGGSDWFQLLSERAWSDFHHSEFQGISHSHFLQHLPLPGCGSLSLLRRSVWEILPVDARSKHN